MSVSKILYCLLLFIGLVSCNQDKNYIEVSSPNGKNSINFGLTETGQPQYWVSHGDKTIIDKSEFGFDAINSCP